MKRVTGIGGIFFKANDQKKLTDWHEKHLGLKPDGDTGAVSLGWRELDNPEREGMTVWSVFKEDTEYFDPSRAPFMINYRLDDRDALLEALRAEGVEIARTRLRPLRLDHGPGRQSDRIMGTAQRMS